VYKGVTAVSSELAVSVRVGPVQPDVSSEPLPLLPWMSQDAVSVTLSADDLQQQQQQQQ
jgi:hypothetical protein